MQAFTYSYPTKVYFGEGAAASAPGPRNCPRQAASPTSRPTRSSTSWGHTPTCNHGQGLAVIQPVYYRHILKDAPEKFARFAQVVFGRQTAEEGLEALTAFIAACGLPTKLGQLRSKRGDHPRAAAPGGGQLQPDPD